MGLLPIGVYANLILNRLANERRIAETKTADDGDREKHDKEKEKAASTLELTDRPVRS